MFIEAVLRKNGHWMGTLSEEGGDGGFSVRKRRVFICSEVHDCIATPHASLHTAIKRCRPTLDLSNAGTSVP